MTLDDVLLIDYAAGNYLYSFSSIICSTWQVSCYYFDKKIDKSFSILFSSGIAAFFVVAIGGLIVGLLAAMITAILTK